MGRDMDEYSLPPELVELENRLRDRPGENHVRENMAGGMRDRVMSAVRAELAMSARVPLHSPASNSCGGWCWAAVAAAVLIALNLVVVDGSATEFTGGLRPAHAMNPVQEMQLIDKLQKGILQ